MAGAPPFLPGQPWRAPEGGQRKGVTGTAVITMKACRASMVLSQAGRCVAAPGEAADHPGPGAAEQGARCGRSPPWLRRNSRVGAGALNSTTSTRPIGISRPAKGSWLRIVSRAAAAPFWARASLTAPANSRCNPVPQQGEPEVGHDRAEDGHRQHQFTNAAAAAGR